MNIDRFLPIARNGPSDRRMDSGALRAKMLKMIIMLQSFVTQTSDLAVGYWLQPQGPQEARDMEVIQFRVTIYLYVKFMYRKAQIIAP